MISYSWMEERNKFSLENEKCSWHIQMSRSRHQLFFLSLSLSLLVATYIHIDILFDFVISFFYSFYLLQNVLYKQDWFRLTKTQSKRACVCVLLLWTGIFQQHLLNIYYTFPLFVVAFLWIIFFIFFSLRFFVVVFGRQVPDILFRYYSILFDIVCFPILSTFNEFIESVAQRMRVGVLPIAYPLNTYAQSDTIFSVCTYSRTNSALYAIYTYKKKQK